jgi:hypothetical protein
MRYYEARQRLDSLWDWTVMHDKIIRTAAPCSEEPGCHHKTKGEAEQHFYFTEIKKAVEISEGDRQLNQCEISDCEALTHKGLKTHYLFRIPVLLCDTHRNTKGLMDARPYHSGMKLWIS